MMQVAYSLWIRSANLAHVYQLKIKSKHSQATTEGKVDLAACAVLRWRNFRGIGICHVALCTAAPGTPAFDE